MASIDTGGTGSVGGTVKKNGVRRGGGAPQYGEKELSGGAVMARYQLQHGFI